MPDEIEKQLDVSKWATVGVVIGGFLLAAYYYFFVRDQDTKTLGFALTSTQTDFVGGVLSAINVANPGLVDATKLILLGQAALETNWGRTTGYKQGNNLFNTTSVCQSHDASGNCVQYADPIVTGPDTEYRADGSVVKITQPFIAYPTLADSVNGLFNFLNGPRYIAVNASGLLRAGDVTSYLAALSTAGFFTLPLASYLAGVQDAMAQIDPIVQSLGGYGGGGEVA